MLTSLSAPYLSFNANKRILLKIVKGAVAVLDIHLTCKKQAHKQKTTTTEKWK